MDPDLKATLSAGAEVSASEDDLALLALNLIPGVGVLTRLSDGTILGVNKSFCRATGYSAEEVLGRSATELQNWANPGDRELFVQKLRERGEWLALETRFQAKDGTLIMAEISGRLVIHQGEECILSITHDISDRNRAQEQFRRSESQFQAAFESAPLGMALVAPDTTMLKTNQRLCAMLGYEPQDLEGISFEEFTHPDDLGGGPRRFERIRQGVEEYNWAEKRYLHRDGSVVWVLVSNSAVRDENGEILHFVCHILDITGRKATEEALKDSQRRLADIIDFLPDATWVIDLKGRVVAWNRALEELSGVKAKNILGKGGFEHSLPFWGERRPALIDMVISPDHKLEKSYIKFDRERDWIVSESFHPNLGKNGLYLASTAGPLFDAGGNLVGAIESVRDITGQKLSEKQKEEQARLQGVMEMAGAACHELNQPLQSLTTQFELMALDLPRDQQIQGRIKSLLDDLGRLGDITKRIQGITRYRTKDYTREVKIVDLDKASPQD